MTGRPLVLLDVDGVINLARFRSSAQRDALLTRGRQKGWFHRRPTDAYADDRLLVNLAEVRPAIGELVAACGEHDAELAWATTWCAHANDVFYPLLGLAAYGLRVLPVARVDFRLRHKAPTVIPWTEGRPWAWLEDQRRELELARALTAPGVPCRPVLVDTATGLTRAHAEIVREWLEGL